MDNIMHQILENNLNNNEIIDRILKSVDLTPFVSKLFSIKKNKVYQKNNFHGLHHSQKVLLFAYILGVEEKLDEVDLSILMDAAIYHDMGRENDTEDTIHGYSSSLRIKEVVRENPIYKDQTNLNILEAIVDMHSVTDSHMESIFESHDIPQEFFSRYEKLAKILKDADALDRLRFGKKSPASLKQKFLRFAQSKTLISFSEEINHLYYEQISKANDSLIKAKIKDEFHGCFHSIGFDFFKIKSILENGILSRTLMKEKKLDVPRNFTGGNLENWISVVDAKMIPHSHQAFDEFTTKGIGFFCLADTLFKPLDSLAAALESGLPYNKSNYEDEKYVYKKIDKDRIVHLFIPKPYIHTDIRSLNYIYNTLNKEMLLQKIEYYVRNTNTETPGHQNKPFLEAIQNYCDVLDVYLGTDEVIIPTMDNEVFSALNTSLNVINGGIQEMIYSYYSKCLEKNPGEKITVLEVVNYQLHQLNQAYNLLADEEEVIFQINDIRSFYKEK